MILYQFFVNPQASFTLKSWGWLEWTYKNLTNEPSPQSKNDAFHDLQLSVVTSVFQELFELLAECCRSGTPNNIVITRWPGAGSCKSLKRSPPSYDGKIESLSWLHRSNALTSVRPLSCAAAFENGAPGAI